MQKAEHGLIPFGKTNLNIVYNNIGICHFLKGDFSNAYKHFVVSKNLSISNMAQLFSCINLACAQAVSGQLEAAINSIREIEPQVILHPLDRVRQKYYINRLLIEFINNNKS